MKTSKFLSLNSADILKGFLVALIAFVIDFTEKTILPELSLPLEVKLFVAYLLKNLFTAQKEVFEIQKLGGTNPPPKKDEK